jgi:hypothetical protein
MHCRSHSISRTRRVATHRVLEGLRVVAIAANLPGPLAAARLRALGASVVKIESLRGDPLADAAPAWYEQIIAGMEIVQFDLHEPEAKTPNSIGRRCIGTIRDCAASRLSVSPRPTTIVRGTISPIRLARE